MESIEELVARQQALFAAQGAPALAPPPAAPPPAPEPPSPLQLQLEASLAQAAQAALGVTPAETAFMAPEAATLAFPATAAEMAGQEPAPEAPRPGRKPGQKDSAPRKRRTKAEIEEARLLAEARASVALDGDTRVEVSYEDVERAANIARTDAAARALAKFLPHEPYAIHTSVNEDPEIAKKVAPFVAQHGLEFRDAEGLGGVHRFRSNDEDTSPDILELVQEYQTAAKPRSDDLLLQLREIQTALENLGFGVEIKVIF